MGRGALLLVDDDPELLALLAAQLGARGFQVEGVPGIPEARTAMSAQAFDAALVDLNLGEEGTGLDLIEGLQRTGGSTGIVLMSGAASVPAVVEAMKRGAFDFLEKPFDVERLVVVLDRAVERARLLRENATLRAHVGSRTGLGLALSRAALGTAMLRLYEDVDRVAATDVPVLITGESGVGKEFVARAVHAGSRRSKGPWIVVNCGGLPRELIDSELFGHEKGAFTGAVDRKLGLVEVADGGTLFLDEIGELSSEAQTKLLRFIELGEFRHVGGAGRPLRVDVRIVAATNRDLDAAMRVGRFREDLYFRLAAVTLAVPPLRARREEIRPFLAHFLELRGETERYRPDVIATLSGYDWPGNLRELRNAVDKLLLRGAPSTVTVEDARAAASGVRTAWTPRPAGATVAAEPLVAAAPAAPASPVPAQAAAPDDDDDLSLDLAERRQIERALVRYSWNQTRAARALGLSPRTLYRKLRELGLKPPGRTERPAAHS